MNRRTFLSMLGLGAASTAVAAVVPSIVLAEPEPVRRYWQVPRNAPVGARTFTCSTVQVRWAGQDWMQSHPVMREWIGDRQARLDEHFKSVPFFDADGRAVGAAKLRVDGTAVVELTHDDALRVLESIDRAAFRPASPFLVYGNADRMTIGGSRWVPE